MLGRFSRELDGSPSVLEYGHALDIKDRALPNGDFHHVGPGRLIRLDENIVALTRANINRAGRDWDNVGAFHLHDGQIVPGNRKVDINQLSRVDEA
jgi:hypothetical protein